MIVAGADPGSEGALAFYDTATSRIMELVDMPMSSGELLLRELVVDILAALDGRRVGFIMIEKQIPFAMAGRSIGASSAFHLGQRFMAIRAIAACYGWPTEIVSPVKWKRHFGLQKDKALAVAAAGRLMPEDVGRWTVRRGFCTKAAAIGRAEAALIALYGVRMLGGIATGEAA